MKKLYENIEDIKIKGSVDQLSDIVRGMDISLQNIADNTDLLAGILIKFSASNRGSQYEKVVTTAMQLRDEMFDASIELNEMQNQIVAYQNKVYRYEDMAATALTPNPYLVQKRQISVDTSVVQFNRTDMLQLAAALRNYSERVFHHIKTINEKKNAAASIWQDTQYTDFAAFVDDITRKVINAIKVYEEYVIHLEEKIKELN